jgi:hypothetical protein
MKARPSALVLMTVLLVAIACGTTTPNLQATRVAQDKATMEALATVIAEPPEAQEPPTATSTVPLTPSPVPSTPTPVVIVVTATPQATPTLVLPTLTPAPTDTPVPPTPTVSNNTPPESILEVGASWQQNDIRLRLEEVSFSPDCLRLHFNLFNNTDHTIVTVINEQNFSVVDNLGRQWRFSSFGFCYYGCTDYTEEIIDTIEAGERFKTEGCDTWKVAFYGSVTDTRVDEVIVTVEGLSQISNARWRIPIYH